jgi:hypothetical protein
MIIIIYTRTFVDSFQLLHVKKLQGPSLGLLKYFILETKP